MKSRVWKICIDQNRVAVVKPRDDYWLFLFSMLENHLNSVLLAFSLSCIDAHQDRMSAKH